MRILVILTAVACIPQAHGDTPQVTGKLGKPSSYGVTVQTDPAHPLDVSGSFSASTTGRATAAAPTYSEGTDNPLSIDLSGNIRTLATAETAAKATAADPSYVEGSTSAISQDLSGHLRTIAALPSGAATSAKQDTGNTSLASIDGKDFATQTTLALIKAKTDNLDVALSTRTKPADSQTISGSVSVSALPGSPAQEHTTAASPNSCRLSDGAAFYDGTKTGQLPAALDGSGFLKVHEQGTVTTSPPSNASTNVAQWAGTAVDVNSGAKSAGTVRVVLATDQPQLTNKLLVTPDSVALPANQSVNVNQLAGTTTDTNSGVKSAGTLRVVLATDQPALTNKLLVTPDSVALPANQSVNTAQFGGTNVSTGTGAGGAGIPRVTISNDSSLAANQSVNLAQVGGTNTLTGGVAGSQGVGGLAANAAAASGNPVYTAGLGFNGIAFAPRYCDKIAAITTLSTTATVQQIAAVGSQKIYICGYLIKASTATAAINLKWVEGTGANCVTGTADVTPTIFTTPTAAPATANWTLGPFGSPGIPWMATAGDALCINQSATTNATTLSGVILYTQN